MDYRVQLTLLSVLVLSKMPDDQASDVISFDLHSISEDAGDWTTTLAAGTKYVADQENYNNADICAAPLPTMRQRNLDTEILDDDTYFEASEDAHVWHVYDEEASKMDTSLAEGSNRAIDVLLVFIFKTGLFSAVLTTFVIQSYQLMIPSSLDTTNDLLSQYLSSLMVNSTLGKPSNSISSAAETCMDSSPSLLELSWVNGLWFAALACSLSAALFSMLAKHWLQTAPNTSGSPRHRARQRQRRHNQIQTWHVMGVINALPLLLHISLLLFFAGLIVLLWSGSLAITVVTCAIVAVVFGFYFGSIWISMLYPECPYQHPLSEQLRSWVRVLQASDSHHSEDFEMALQDEQEYSPWKEQSWSSYSSIHNLILTISIYTMQNLRTPTVKSVSSDDYIDACSIVWLFTKCPNASANIVALQAIAGLPRHFTAFHVLRQAGAISRVLHEFRACFHRDATLDPCWYVLKADDAEKYCRSWMRLTCGATYQWPEELIELLDTLREKGSSNVRAVADCTRAIAGQSRDGRLLVLSHLSSYTEGRVEFGHEMQCWLLDTFLQCSLLFRTRFRPKDHIVKATVPVLIRLLHHTKQTSALHVRSAIALSLSYMTGGTVGLALFHDEGTRRDKFYDLIIPALTAIVDDPSSFGVDEDALLDLIAVEFSRLASLSLSGPSALRRLSKDRRHRMSISSGELERPRDLQPIAQQGLTKLYLDGRVKDIPSNVLSDVLQILYPPITLTKPARPLFVKALLQSLWSTSDPRVLVGSVLRLLEPLLITNSDSAVVDTFIDGKGVAILLRAAQTGDTDSRRLQLDCLRNVCLFIRTAAECQGSGHTKDLWLDHIFHSDFFTTLNATIAARRWWLPEVAKIWIPALLKLYDVRPRELVWEGVESTFRRFAESHEGKDGCLQLVVGLDRMKVMIKADS